MNKIQNQMGTQRLLYFYDTKSQLLFTVFWNSHFFKKYKIP